ncbi:hypothetical protein Hdeb2414_s0003g00091391 [Helianthus debilis subsp. tardiflorus]
MIEVNRLDSRRHFGTDTPIRTLPQVGSFVNNLTLKFVDVETFVVLRLC